jgi:hypothetical protein
MRALARMNKQDAAATSASICYCKTGCATFGMNAKDDRLRALVSDEAEICVPARD